MSEVSKERRERGGGRGRGRGRRGGEGERRKHEEGKKSVREERGIRRKDEEREGRDK